MNDATPYLEDRLLVEALRRGNEQAFAELIDRYQSSLNYLARVYLPSRQLAEEAVQETWLAVLQGVDRFEGRSSLKTWIFRILINRARNCARPEARTTPFSSLERLDADEPIEAVAPPASDPVARVLSREINTTIVQALAALPPRQRAVIGLRDVHGWSSSEVRDVLGLSEVNQRVLLHRARVYVRAVVADYLDERDRLPAAA
jgi:RNA polymerase sigma-70 factor (ECF subfamily)